MPGDITKRCTVCGRFRAYEEDADRFCGHSGGSRSTRSGVRVWPRVQLRADGIRTHSLPALREILPWQVVGIRSSAMARCQRPSHQSLLRSQRAQSGTAEGGAGESIGKEGRNQRRDQGCENHCEREEGRFENVGKEKWGQIRWSKALAKTTKAPTTAATRPVKLAPEAKKQLRKPAFNKNTDSANDPTWVAPVWNDDVLLGAHVSVAGGSHEAPRRAKAIGATAMQIFTKMANRWAERKEDARRPRLPYATCQVHTCARQSRTIRI